MSKMLDIDENINIWIPAYDAVRAGKKPQCPKCKSDDIEVISDSDDKGVGFMLITCNGCGKSAHFSRVEFK